MVEVRIKQPADFIPDQQSPIINEAPRSKLPGIKAKANQILALCARILYFIWLPEYLQPV